MGTIPKGWKVGDLKKIADITMGQSPSGDSYNELGDGMVFYQGRAEFGDRFPTRRLFTTSPNRIAEENSVLFSVRAPVGDLNIATEKCCIGRGLASIKAKENNNAFVFYTMKSLYKIFDIFNSEGTVFGSINRNDLSQLQILIPPNEQIRSFENIASQFDYQILNNFNQNQSLIQLRDTLLPKLMSGEISVDEIEI
ncbi:MAG: restriction endonuclease subunit S [Bacteroidaceae bacterium]|nr:restriction endonuclease subunit S [Bacteroidaceae bacterium]